MSEEEKERKAIIHWLGMGKDARDALLKKHRLATYYGIMPWSQLPEIIKTLVRNDVKE